MLSNKKVSLVLKQAIEKSKVKKEVWGKCNGFAIITGYTLQIDGEKLQDRIETLISLLEEG